MSLQSLGAPIRHRSWCDVDSHDGYATCYDPGAGCTSPARVEVIHGRHRVSGFVEDTGRGPAVRLVDAPLHEPLSPAAAVRLARAIEDLATLATGDVPDADKAGDRAGGRVADALALFRHYAARVPAGERPAVIGSLVAAYAAVGTDDAELGGIVRALVDAADVEWSTDVPGGVR